MASKRNACGLLLWLAWMASAGANPLAPGDTVSELPGTTVADEPQLAGTVVEDVTVPFRYRAWVGNAADGSTHDGDVTGSVQSRVVRARDGTYDFYWRISVDRDAFLPVAAFTVAGAPPATYDADWRRDSGGDVSPAFVEQAANGQVDWHFGQFVPPSTEVYPGRRTYLVFLNSQARHYTRHAVLSLLTERDAFGDIFLTWGGASGPYPTFAPADADDPATTDDPHGAPTAVANALLHRDPLLRSLGGHAKGCVLAHIATQQAHFQAYGPRGGPYDAAAIRAAVRTFAGLCR